MKIVYLDFDDIKNPLLSGGQAKATFEVGRRLAKSGHQVSVISSRFPGSFDRKEEGMNYYHIGLGSKNIRLNNLAYILTVPFYIRKISADVIIECFTAPVSTLFTPLLTKIPVVARPTSFEAERFSRIYHLPFHLIETFGCRFYKYFLPANIFHEEKMRDINTNIISEIIPEGVEESFFNLEQKGQKYILFLGRLDISQKGIDLLLSSYSKVYQEIDLPLVIAGNGPDEAKVKAMIKDLKLANYVQMVGPAYGEKKDHLLSQALFVVLPSRHEGFCLFALEALAAGLPIISFDIPGLSWMGEDVNLKIKPFDVSLYAQGLVAFTKKRAADLKPNCRPFARKFSWDTVSGKYEKFIKNILG